VRRREIGGRHPVEHRLASQRMCEPIIAGAVVGVRDQHSGADREVDPLEDRVRAEIANLDQEGGIDDVACNRGQLEDTRVSDVECGQSTGQRVLD